MSQSSFPGSAVVLAVALACTLYVAGYARAVKPRELYSLEKNAPLRIRLAEFEPGSRAAQTWYCPALWCDKHLRPAYWRSAATPPPEIGSQLAQLARGKLPR